MYIFLPATAASARCAEIDMDIHAAWAAVRFFGTVKNTPYAWQVTSTRVDSGETEAQDAAEVARLFDRDLTSGYAPSATALVDVYLDDVHALSEIRVYGPADYRLSVQVYGHGQWLDVPGLDGLDLDAAPGQWQRWPVPAGVESDIVSLQLVPATFSHFI